MVDSGVNVLFVPSFTQPGSVARYDSEADTHVGNNMACILYNNNALGGGSFLKMPFRNFGDNGTVVLHDGRAIWISTKNDKVISYISLTYERKTNIQDDSL